MLTRDLSAEKKVTILICFYDSFGRNYIKDSFFANYDIKDDDWYTDIRFLDANKYRGKVDLFVGGSPCQPYSLSGKRLGLEDVRGTLFYDFARIIKDIQPKVFIYENVLGMKSSRSKDGKSIALGCALEVFDALGYDLHWMILDAKNYGVPQHRERIWVVRFRSPTDFRFPRPIALKKRVWDYLDEEVKSTIGTLRLHYLSGSECLGLMGFLNFKVADSIKSLEKTEAEKKLCGQAGNSMVVDCLMALFKQMDITKYAEPENTFDPVNSDVIKDSFFQNSDLESMSMEELSSILEKVSSLLQEKRNYNRYLKSETSEMFEQANDFETKTILEETDSMPLTHATEMLKKIYRMSGGMKLT